MNKKISLGAAISFMAIVAAITFTLTMIFSLNIFNSKILNVNDRENLYTKLSEIDSMVRQNYQGTIDEDLLLDAIADGYVNGLDDRYAAYYTAEEMKKETQANNGELVGIGVTVTEDESGYIRVVGVYDDSPASVAGIQADDLIIQVDGEDVKSIGYSQATDNIQGDEGTKVRLLTRRDGVDQAEMELVRKRVEIPSVSYRMIGTNGYVKIDGFSGSTVDQFNNAVDSLIDEGAQALIFDVRNNSGGTLDSVVKMLDKLLPAGVIATSTTADGTTTELARSDASEITLPMVTLTNANTASAAELFVAALRDYEKTEVVGTTTFGKGVMQTTYTLTDGSGIKFTTAKFNPPVSENFDGVGITPDYEVTLTADQEKNFENLDETTDPQLQKAVEVANALQN